MKARSLAILFLFIITIGKGQSFRTTTYQIEQGLPTALTKSIFKDDVGFIWIGTDMGLIRFDGKRFTLFKDELPSTYLKGFYKKKNGDFLVIHDMGLSKITSTRDTLIIEPFLAGSRGFTDTTVNYPKTIFEDSQGALWVSEPQSLVKYFNGDTKRYYFDIKTKTASFSRSYQLYEDQHQTLWAISQRGHIFYLDRKKDKFIETDHGFNIEGISAILNTSQNTLLVATESLVLEITTNAQRQISSIKPFVDLPNISCMAEDMQGNLYLGTWFNGLFMAQQESGQYKITSLPKPKYKVINHIHVNENDEIWISSDDGIALLQKPYFHKLDLASDRPFIQSVSLGKNEKIYTTNGGSIFEICPQTFQSKELHTLSGNENVMHVVYQNGKVFFGTTLENLYWIENGKLNVINLGLGGAIFNLYPDSKGNIWIRYKGPSSITKITPEMKVVHYGEDKGILSPVSAIKENHRGQLYIGGLGDKTFLYQYNEETDAFLNISPTLPFSESEFSVDDIAISQEGTMWLASNKGLYIIHGQIVNKINLGLYNENDVLKAVTLSNDGGLWIGTNAGLLKHINGQTILFDDFNGLPSKTIARRSIVIDKQQRVWLGTSAGLGYTRNASKSTFTKTPTPVFLSLTVNGQPVRNSTIEFPVNSYLEASFISLAYPANKLIYQYRLKGFHSDWITLKDKLDIMVPLIADGKYTLEVRALQQGEFSWSDPATYHLTVKVAWYLSYWAFIAYVILLSLIIWVIVRLNTARLLKEKEKLERIIFERTSEILQQKEEIETQRDSLMELNEDIIDKKNKIEEKSKALEVALTEIQEHRDILITLNKDIIDKKNKIEEKSIALEEAFKEINQQKTELEALNATKNRFFSIVAHDLKGPINSLSSFADLLANYADAMTTDEIKKVALELSKAVKNTSTLTENLLTWARSQMEKLSHKPQSVNILQMIEENKTVLANTAENKNINIYTEIKDDFNVWADKDQLTFVIRNLVSNALKFTKPGGSVTIRARLMDEQAEISVVDTGVGMPEKVCKNIFNIDSKHSTIGTSGEKGTGLGLLLCKEFIEKNGGKIRVESIENQGSTFSFSLKLTHKEEVKT
jgi:signal transduction histidine kinase/ligand-binding sensor domain-containing protein